MANYSLLAAILLAIVGLVKVASAFEYANMKREWVAYLKERGVKGDLFWADVTTDSTLSILRELNIRHPSPEKEFIIGMSNTTSDDKCDEYYIRLMNGHFINCKYLPVAIRNYMNHCRLEQLEACKLRFEGPLWAAAKSFGKKDAEKFKSLDEAMKAHSSPVLILHEVLRDKFHMTDRHRSKSLAKLRSWCDDVKRRLEPGAKILTLFPSHDLESYLSRQDPTVKLVAYYALCQEADRGEIERVLAGAKKSGGRGHFRWFDSDAQTDTPAGGGLSVLQLAMI